MNNGRMSAGDSPILVTGGTGTLGRPTVALLQNAGQAVRVLSRKPGAGRVIGDLDTGAGLAEALDGVRTVLHLAMGWTKEAEQTKRLALAARAAGVEHLLYISIVGIDRNQAFPYYRAKLESEQAIRASGVPFTILRATQFHDFVANLVKGQLGGPIAFLPPMTLQPIAVDEVAARIAELAPGGPQGRVDDIAGPEQRTLKELASIWYAAHGRPTKRILSVPIPGRAFRNYREGTQLGTLPGYGRQSFADWVRQTAAS